MQKKSHLIKVIKNFENDERDQNYIKILDDSQNRPAVNVASSQNRP